MSAKTLKNVSGAKPYSLWNIWIVSLSVKALLSIGYHSTDFDVHRNWLAITYNLPVSKWYVENTSQWTLDYPPFFAYFEWFLAHLVPDFVKRDGCLAIVEKGIYSLPTVMFQRLSVIASETVLFLSLQWCVNTSGGRNEARRSFVVAASLVLSPGLFIIDHIHFQYNGMMYGFLIMMINSARLEKYLMCGFWFSLLLCFKHIYLYLAPAVFVFLLRSYCLNLNPNKTTVSQRVFAVIRWRNCIKLATVVLSVFTVAFGPFIYFDVMPALLERLFPFSRGLNHAYWAPNMWALYSFVDRVLIQVYKRVPYTQLALQKTFKFDPSALADTSRLNLATRGIIGDSGFLILPMVTPRLTFVLTLFYQVMALIPLFLQPNFYRFVGALTSCGFSSFLFGWHVHEKAILLVIFPMSFVVTRDSQLLSAFKLLASCGYVSLFPLIFTSEEWLIKVVFTLLWSIVFYYLLGNVTRVPKRAVARSSFLLDRVINGYILGLVPLVVLVSLIEVFDNKFPALKKMQFLKLMMMSVYCGLGVVASWNRFSWLFFVHDSIWKD